MPEIDPVERCAQVLELAGMTPLASAVASRAEAIVAGVIPAELKRSFAQKKTLIGFLDNLSGSEGRAFRASLGARP